MGREQTYDSTELNSRGTLVGQNLVSNVLLRSFCLKRLIVEKTFAILRNAAEHIIYQCAFHDGYNATKKLVL